ncbi:hypothetical protein E0Z10_g4312 [Xylaria hypoxylon]|uniref:Uncharacterized protein n=1 Tax=Xylaria hypoxylon TaxID=37992 RepID=A0A4Z0Z4C9_9PEZI|nr:hypothetical protein E0Z10_g4312 [Xylaria hypoxylon]
MAPVAQFKATIVATSLLQPALNESWFQKTRAQTLRASKHGPENRPSSDTSNTASNAGYSNDQNSQNGQTTAPTVEKTLTEFLYKPATIRGLPTMSPEVVNAYNLDWRELEPVLKRIYPGIFFKENLAVEDHYLIYVPRTLTSEERDEINKIRKQHRAREKSTAGGGQIRAREEHSPDSPRRPIEDDD